MSGSILGDRIPHSAVQDTIDSYRQILKAYPAFKSLVPTGSTVDPAKKDHGDVDVCTYLEGTDIKQAKKDFMDFLNSLPDTITVPFRGGRNKGKKCMMYADIVTCQIPIIGFEGLLVQIDNAIVLSEIEQGYKKSFLDLPGEKQALLMGLTRVILSEENPEKVFRRMGIHKLPELEANQAFEFVLSPTGLTLRKVTLDSDYRETAREDVWKSHDWSKVNTLLQGFDLNKSFDELLSDISAKGYSDRSKRRIMGIVNSVLVIGPGEQGKPKGDNKQRAKDKVTSMLGEVEEPEETNTVALYGGGFKPPHKAHFANAQKLAEKADRLIIFIGPKVREGVPITAEQSKRIWDIYKHYIHKPVEIRIADKTPISDIYQMIDNPELQDIHFIIGKSVGADEDKKFAYLLKNQAKYPNVKLKTLPIIADKEDAKFSASTLRQSIEILRKGTWMPDVLDRDDARKVLEILLKPLEQQALKEEVEAKTAAILDEVRGITTEGYSGTPIALTSVVSSESREKLAKAYWELQAELGDIVKFNQSFIDIKCDTDQDAGQIYTELFKRYYGIYSVTLDRGNRVIIRPFRHPDNSDQYDITGGYRTDAENQRVQESLEPGDQVLDNKEWVKHAAGLIQYMRKNGLKLDPLPDIVLNKEEQQPGLLAKTAEYDPVDKVITVYTKGRAFKDSLRSLAHELIHSQQDIDGKIGQVNTNKTSDNDPELNDLEKEAYEKGNLLFRGYTESLQG